MELLLVLFAVVVILPVVVLVRAAILRFVFGLVGEEVPGWPMALVTVVIAGLAQDVAMGALFGADAGVCGGVFGFLVWSALVSLLNGVTFGRAALIGLVMAVVQWLLNAVLLFLLVVTGLAAIVGLAAAL